MANYEQTNGSSWKGEEYGASNDQVMVQALSRALVQAERDRTVPAAAELTDTEEEQQLDLVALFWHVMGKLKWIILAAILGAVIAGVYAWFIRVPVYAATSKLYILSTGDSAINLSDLQIGAALTQDYQEVFKTWEVHEMVRSNLGLEYEYQFLQNHLSISNPTNTRLLYITYQDTDPERAKLIANTYAEAGKELIIRNMGTKEPTIFSKALTPTIATGRSKTTIVIIGFLLGAVLSLVAIVAMFLLDDRPRTPDEITRVTNLPVLAVVPKQEKTRKSGSSHHSSHSSSGAKGGSR